MSEPEQGRRTVMVFIRDRERDLGTGFKTRGTVTAGEFDDAPWQAGEFACDCARGSILYGGGEFPCGTSRFVIEQVLDWETGESLHVDPTAESDRRVPDGAHRRPGVPGE
jgi:hypothetical protein